MAVDRLGFGPFRYDAAQALLFREGEFVTVGGRAQRLLALLLARRGEIVSKADPNCVR
jgi:DNA-binding winged helix-turn-helix (wHTH) protein